MDLLIEIVLWPLFGLFEAFVGLLWPADDPEVRRLQRSIRRMILAGLGCLVVGSATAYATKSVGVFLVSLAIAVISLIWAGQLGRRIETDWRSRQKQASDT